MGMDCRMITDDFQKEIDFVKQSSVAEFVCIDENRARKILNDNGIKYHSVDEVIKNGEYYSVELPKSYAFYDEKFALIAYLDIDEEKLYF